MSPVRRGLSFRRIRRLEADVLSGQAIFLEAIFLQFGEPGVGVPHSLALFARFVEELVEVLAGPVMPTWSE